MDIFFYYLFVLTTLPILRIQLAKFQRPKAWQNFASLDVDLVWLVRWLVG
ncbi:hypothetical protein EV200_101146 [Pedobacter psychrotolerans]|uniref:Uncharacterized protein n=1 Tax=Pedobacter psychrotolerans TaxID=1843235 RepID=A0A4R2HPY6_9SPHI|nr:hypothetical protein EV200_101146 [Pedobacter psychrotolerans]